MSTIILVILILFLVGALPAWPHSASWGYGPSGGLGLVLLVVVARWCRQAQRAPQSAPTGVARRSVHG